MAGSVKGYYGLGLEHVQLSSNGEYFVYGERKYYLKESMFNTKVDAQIVKHVSKAYYIGFFRIPRENKLDLVKMFEVPLNFEKEY